MLRKIFFAAATVMAVASANASVTGETGSLSVSKGMFNVDANVNINDLKVKSGEIVIVTPVIANGPDTLLLPSVGVYGNRSWIQRQRGVNNLPAQPSVVLQAKKMRDSVYSYHAAVPYQKWFDGAKLSLRHDRYGCAGCNRGSQSDGPLTTWAAPQLNTDNCFIYAEAEVDTVKTREISGRANVSFPVNQTVLLDNFRSNAAELAVIRASVDSVRYDKDVTIDAMSIKGFASPEGAYDNNVRLAMGRTEALRQYVEKRYEFPKDFIHTSYEAEDWNGLRQWVSASSIANRQAILSIIESSLKPDAKDAKIKREFPKQYEYLLKNVYPALRHSDYSIKYTVKSYTSPEEILQVMETRPGNLSLNEFMIAARSLKPGSDRYNKVIETALSIYPDSPVANINAANNAMQRGMYDRAEQYLSKAGSSPEATYARGLLALFRSDYDNAERLLNAAGSLGLSKAAALVEQIPALRELQLINRD